MIPTSRNHRLEELEDVRASLDESKEQIAEYRERAAVAEMAAELLRSQKERQR
jgi:hypothetical protein